VITGAFGMVYLAIALVLGVELMRQSFVLLRKGTRAAALSLHLYALVYLTVLFAGMVLDAKI
jgi:protoheme IX farnesyltransferase